MSGGIGRERADSNPEFAEAAHVMSNQPLPFAFVGWRPIGFLPGDAQRECPVDHHRQ
jgi:hypothetical protein